MCIDFVPTTPLELEEYFEVEPPSIEWKREVWQDYAAPIIIGVDGQRAAVGATYGFLPKDKQPPGKRLTTMNARSETVGQLPTYKRAWSSSQLCLVPLSGFFEPNYESGKAVRWWLGLENEKPFAVAGIWRTWDAGTEVERHSFSQLTVNSDDHPFMNRFHKPGDEKRSLVIVPENDYDEWLNCKNPELARAFLKTYPAELMRGHPAPLPSRKAPSPQGGLF